MPPRSTPARPPAPAARLLLALVAALGVALALTGPASANEPPIAVDDYLGTVEEGGACTGFVPITENDSDPDPDDIVSLNATGQPTYGQLAISGDAIEYCLLADTILNDTQDAFTYTVVDGSSAESEPATVTVDLVDVPPANQAPVANDDVATATAGVCVDIPVAENDADPDGDALSVTLVVTGYANQTFDSSRYAEGIVGYCPDAGYVGPGGFNYTITDGTYSASATVTIDVAAPPNAPPVAVDDDGGSMNEGTCLVVTPLTNDSDPEGEALTITDYDGGTIGGVGRWRSPGELSYCVHLGRVAVDTQDSFPYTVSDGSGTDVGVVSVLVLDNEPPVALDDTASVTEGSCVVVRVLDNDSDPDGDPIEIFAANDQSVGSATVVDDGGAPAIEYCTAGDAVAGDTTVDFSYLVADRINPAVSASVSVSVTDNQNVSPVAVDDTATVGVNACADIHVTGNDTDAEGDRLSVVGVVAGPEHGAADTPGETLAAGYVSYCSTDDYVGADVFTYRVTDGLGTSTAQVTVTVGDTNPPPVPGDDAVEVPQGARILFRVTGNDTNPGYGPLRITDVTQPSTLGSIAIVEDGNRLDYQAPADAFGTDEVTYTVEDSNGNTGTGVVSIEVVEGRRCVDDTATVLRGQSVTIDVLANDPGLDGDAPASISENFDGLLGRVTVVDDTTFSPRRYTAPTDLIGTDVYTYENRVIKDGRNLICGATVTITVTNEAPIAVDDAATTTRGATVSLDVLDNDVDLDPLTAVDFATPDGFRGTLATSAFGTIAYTAPGDFLGAATFTYRATDGVDTSEPATVTIRVIAPPVVAAATPQATTEGAAAIVRLGSFADDDGDGPWRVTVAWGDGTANTVYTLASQGSLGTPIHVFPQDGAYTPRVTVVDQADNPGVASLSVTVANVAPTVRAIDQANAPLASDRFMLGYFYDPGADAPWQVTVHWGDGSTDDTIGVGAERRVFYAPHAYAAPGSYVVTLTVVDDRGASSSAGFTLRVGNVVPEVRVVPDQTGAPLSSSGYLLGYFRDPLSSGPWAISVDWGDGSPPSTSTTSVAGQLLYRPHAYAAAGTYPVTLTVRDDEGASASRRFTMAAGNVAPDVRVSANVPNAPRTSAGYLLGYFRDPLSSGAWTVTVGWGDATTAESFSVTTAGPLLYRPHTYATTGPKVVTLTVTDEAGASASRSFTLTVQNQAPDLRVPANVTGAPLTSTRWFLGYFLDPGTNEGPWTVAVDWGDGGTDAFQATAAGPVLRAGHTFAVAGTYTVRVSVTDADGATTTKSFTMTVA